MKMSGYFIIVMILGLTVARAQEKAMDSLWQTWEGIQLPDTIRLEALKGIIIKNKYYLNHLDSSLYLADKIVAFAEAKNLKPWISEGYRLKAVSQYYHGQYEKAILFYEKVLEIKKDINDLKGEGSTNHSIAVAYRSLGDLPRALEYNLRALTLRKEIANEKGIALSLQSISTVYSYQNKFDEALNFAQQAYEISEKINYDPGMANAAVSIANAYSDMANFSEALSYYNKALNLYEELGRPRNEATCLDNIGNLYVRQKDFKAARQFQEKALALRKKSRDKKGLALSYINLGVTHHELENYQVNIDYCQLGLTYAQEIKNQRLIFNACECLYQGYEGNGDLKNAFQYYQFYIAAKDSIEGVEKTKLVEEIESRYELKEKEAQLTEQELDLARERNRRSTTIIMALLVVGIIATGFLWWRSRLQRSRKAADLIAEQEHAEYEKLQELDRLKSTFFTNISHEFRTPLTLIMSPLEQMLTDTLKGDSKKYLRIMQRNGQRLQDLINQLLDLSKLESGHLKLNLIEANLSSFLLSTAQSFSSLADRKQIVYSIKGPEKNINASFDRDVLEKILLNLISNAFKFTPEEGEININFTILNNQLEIGVMDTGIGIPLDQQTSIFNRFYSSAATSDWQMSSGIGLALTKELVELHEGTIIVESQEGLGSRFIVRMPLLGVSVLDQPVHHDVPVPSLVQPATELVNIKTESTKNQTFPLVLIVEDNADVRDYLQDQLQDQFRVALAEDGQLGLQMAKKLQPELILSDVMMPKMDGQQMCKALKTDALSSHIPVILLTAKAEQQDKIQGLETGADAYLTKPFDPMELTIRIQQLIEQRRLLREKFSSDFKFAPSEVTLTSIDANFLKDIKSIVEKNLEDETFSVVELSKAIGMSRSNLFRKLKALTAQSPNQVIREMRLLRAKELLEKGVGNSAEVAFMVGFNSATYFTKCFGDYFGVSPGQVR